MSNGPAKSSYNNLNSLNTNTKLPKIESLAEQTESSVNLKPNSNMTVNAASPTHVNLNTSVTNQSKKLHSNSVDATNTNELNLKSNSILSISTNLSVSKNDLTSNSLTNTNKNNNLNSNSSFFGNNNVFILEETYKLNNSQPHINSNSFNKNSLKRHNELKGSNSKLEGASLNLPQVKQIECKLF